MSAAAGLPRLRIEANCSHSGRSRFGSTRRQSITSVRRAGVLLALLCIGLTGCRVDGDVATTDSDSLVTAPQSVDLAARPVVQDLLLDDRGAPPDELVIEDLVVGDGALVETGVTVTAHFVGAMWSTGSEFDATWDRGQAYTFSVGDQRVIDAWDVGLLGAREGTRRVLISPPELAYGDAGTAVIPPGETLVFIVDVIAVRP